MTLGSSQRAAPTPGGVYRPGGHAWHVPLPLGAKRPAAHAVCLSLPSHPKPAFVHAEHTVCEFVVRPPDVKELAPHVRHAVAPGAA